MFPSLILVGLAALCIGGCTFPRLAAGTSQNPSEESTLTCPGDPEDLDSALGIGLGHAALAVIDVIGPESGPESQSEKKNVSQSGSGGWVRYQMTDVCDRPVTLKIRRVNGKYEMACRWGIFGDGPRQRWLLKCIAQRLAELEGVEIAPVGKLPDFDPAG